MIDSTGQELDRMEAPGVPDDIKYLGVGLDTLAHWMKKVYDALRRQESPNPSIINLNPGVIVTTTTRQRAQWLVFTGGTVASNFALRIGSANAHQWIGNAGTLVIPMPIVFDAGIDISIVDITTPGSVNWRCYVTAYVELEDGNA